MGARGLQTYSGAELKEFVCVPSVNNQPQHAHDPRRCALWLAAHLRRIGLERVRMVSTSRHPASMLRGNTRESS